MEYLNFMMYFFPALFLLNAVLYFIISIRALVLQRSTIITSRVGLVLMTALYVPLLLIFFKINFLEGFINHYLSVIAPVFILLLIVYRFFVTKGYNIYGIIDTDFRNAVIYSLTKNNINYAEKIDSFNNPVGCLTSLVVFQAKALQNHVFNGSWTSCACLLKT
jgi:hypothetical protein